LPRNAIQQFRITPWPGRLPHPLHNELYRYALDEDGVLTGRLGGEHAIPAKNSGRAVAPRPPREVADAGEIYLELLELALSDTGAIVEFVDRYGILGISYNSYALVRALPGFNETIRPMLEAAWPEGRTEGLDNRLHRGVMLVETLTEFRLGALCLRDLAHAWQIVNGDKQWPATPSARWESIPVGEQIRPTWTDTTSTPPRKASEAESLLVSMINFGLEPFHPRLLWSGLNAARPEATFGGPLYSTCCLELYNHILEHATYRQCANDRCRRIFVRQTGRAEHGQHRSKGVKYCSNHCARAQAQREYRRRTLFDKASS
jgi:hypothetical protein